MKLIFTSFTCLLACSVWSQTPCEWFDHDGSGFIGANTWVHVLGQYGTSGSIDVNGSGTVDMEDLLSFTPFFQHSCPTEWHDTTYNHINQLVLIEWKHHESELTGATQNIPAGTKTYRLFVEFSNPEDKVLAVYGNEQTPLHIETDGEWYGFGSGFGGTIVVGDYNPDLNSIFPANEYTTWLTAGQHPVYEDNSIMTAWIHSGQTNNWADHEVDSVIQINDAIGGGWFATNGGGTSSAPNSIEGLSLLGQFTITGGTALAGSVNILAETITDDGHGIEFGEELTFSTDLISLLGCTNSFALNYDPDADYHLPGSCVFAGDINGDGNLTIEDLLILLSQFGCIETCNESDLDEDGSVSINDVLMLLSLL